MPAAAANRKDVRNALTTLLNTALTGVGNPAQAVYGYQVSDLEGQSPVVMVLSSGSERMQKGLGSLKYVTHFRLEVLVFVADAKTGDSWSDQNVEDAIDDIEQAIADVIADNRKTDDWDHIIHDEGLTAVQQAEVGGHPYKMEPISILVEVHD